MFMPPQAPIITLGRIQSVIPSLSFSPVCELAVDVQSKFDASIKLISKGAPQAISVDPLIMMSTLGNQFFNSVIYARTLKLG